MSGTRDGHGRYCKRLEARLRGMGFELLSIIYVPQGANRNHRDGLGTALWNVEARKNGRRGSVHSWDTVTLCAKNGVEIVDEWEVCASAPRKP